MHRTAAVLLAALVTLTLQPVASAAPQAAAASPQSVYQKDVLSETNRERTKRNRVALKKQACVQRFAVRQATRMARQDRMFHQDLGPILRKCRLSTVGENVAYGYGSGAKAVDGWMHSSGHRANILNPQYRLLGVGARQSQDGTWYAAQVFGRKR